MYRAGLLIFSLFACETPKSVAAVLPPHALVVVLDGVRVEEFSSERISELSGVSGREFAWEAWRAMGQAWVVPEALNVGLTSTAPAHATMVTGRTEPVMTAPISEGDAGVYYPEVPTFFEEARRQLGLDAGDALLTSNSVVMPSSTHSIAPGEGEGAAWDLVTTTTGELAEDDADVLARMKAVVNAGPPRAWVVNLHDADRIGHQGQAAAYLDRVEKQSAILLEFLTWIRKSHPEYAASLLLVITADHGRHRHNDDDGWAQHGDSCFGCREVPLFVLGGGALAGTSTEPYATADIAPTVAEHLGINLPFSEGLSLLGGSPREGEVRVAASGVRVAVQRWLDQPTARSEVLVGETVLSTPGAFAAEAPTVLAGELTAACFRELELDFSSDYALWRARCMVETEGHWQDIGFPDEGIGPFAKVQLAESNGVLWAAWLHTPRTRAVDGDYDGVRVATWTSELGWTEQYRREVEYTTTELDFVVNDGGWALAAATSLPQPEQAYSRRILLMQSNDDGVVETEFLPDLWAALPARAERPALSNSGGQLGLAFWVVGAETRGLASYVEEGGIWVPAAWVEANVYPHISPQWDGTRWLVAARIDSGPAICAAGVNGADCSSVKAEFLDSFAVVDVLGAAPRIYASIRDGNGVWRVAEVAPPA